jgi:hypothetical protein
MRFLEINTSNITTLAMIDSTDITTSNLIAYLKLGLVFFTTTITFKALQKIYQKCNKKKEEKINI